MMKTDKSAQKRASAANARNAADAQNTADLVEIGFVAKAHGIRGEIRIATHDANSRVLLDVNWVVVGNRRLAIATMRRAKDGFLAVLEGVGDRDAADALRGNAVFVERDSIELQADEILLHDLVGCRAVLPDGRDYGEIVAIDAGPQDRLVIHCGDVERLLPLVDELVCEIDIDNKRVVVDPPDGLPETALR